MRTVWSLYGKTLRTLALRSPALQQDSQCDSRMSLSSNTLPVCRASFFFLAFFFLTFHCFLFSIASFPSPFSTEFLVCLSHLFIFLPVFSFSFLFCSTSFQILFFFPFPFTSFPLPLPFMSFLSFLILPSFLFFSQVGFLFLFVVFQICNQENKYSHKCWTDSVTQCGASLGYSSAPCLHWM